MKYLIRLSIVLLIAVIACLVFTLPATADDYELQDVMAGNASGLLVEVKGSGQGYYGDSIRVNFNNTTGQGYQVRVPIGLRLVPADSSVQTMYTAGNESLSVPPGASSYLIKAFCGEKHDSAPGSDDTFSPGGFAEGDLMRTLEESNRTQNFTSDANQAVWFHTDGNDISGNDIAQDLAQGSNSVSPGEAAAAGGAAAGTAAIGMVINALLNGGGTATQTAGGGGRGPDDDMIFDPDDEFVGPPGDGFEETPPPPEDGFRDPDTGDDMPDDTFDDSRPPITDSVNVRTPPVEGIPPELQPPIDIADIPPPEDPGDGIMIAGSDSFFQKFWENLQKARTTPTEPVENLPKHMKIPKGEGFFETLWRKFKEGRDMDVDGEAAQAAGQKFRENTPFGSASELNKALSDSVQYSMTGEGDPREFIKQLKREQYEKGGSEGLRWTRRLHNLKSLTNQKTIQPNWKGPPSAYDLKKVLGPHDVVRDLSGGADITRDFIEPDVKDWQTKLIPNYRYDQDGHKAMEIWKDNHDGNMPDHDDPYEVEKFMNLYKQVKGE